VRHELIAPAVEESIHRRAHVGRAQIILYKNGGATARVGAART
jgi:hypothetical protein